MESCHCDCPCFSIIVSRYCVIAGIVRHTLRDIYRLHSTVPSNKGSPVNLHYCVNILMCMCIASGAGGPHLSISRKRTRGTWQSFILDVLTTSIPGFCFYLYEISPFYLVLYFRTTLPTTSDNLSRTEIMTDQLGIAYGGALGM